MRNALLKFAHREIWRRLPRGARRAALLHSSAWLAPRITVNAKAEAPIIVVGPLRAASGLGEGARICHDALKQMGLPVFGIDLSRTLLYDEDYTDYTFNDGRNLLGKGTLFLHVGGPFVPLALLRLGHRLVNDKRIIAHWVWELPQIPRDWRLGVPFVHEVWAPSRFAAEAIKTITGNRPVHVLHHPLDPPSGWPKPASSRGERPFTALVMFNVASSLERKNPRAAIEAFKQAFGDDPNTRLVVKYSNASAFPQALRMLEEAAHGLSNIVFIGNTMNTAEVDNLYAQADVVLSLHRAEGFGLVVAEAMLRGIPVIATNWSGNTDFLTRETGVPIGYRLIPAHDPQDTYNYPALNWADADVREAAEALRMLRADPDLCKRLGAAAMEHASQLFSPRTYGEMVKRLLSVSRSEPRG